MPRRSNNRRQYPSKSSKGQKRHYELETKQTTKIVVNEPNTRKKFSIHDLKNIQPITNNQRIAFDSWDDGKHLMLLGAAGTGKTFVALYLALEALLEKDSGFDKIIICRSAVPTRDLGALPGSLTEKVAAYEEPYASICDDLFPWKKAYENMKEIELIDFKSTSYLRGTSWDNALVIVDEIQNMDKFSEALTVMTRIGNNSRVIMCGDLMQNDIKSQSGLSELIGIMKQMTSVSFVEFDVSDIVRSAFVKEFLTLKYQSK